MSHSKERSEQVCLNCKIPIHGRFCHQCGQENREPKESVWGLITHFFYDITHFDGKFFSTLKYLIVKPGFLPAEYIKGRRADYLNPIRMYVFTSAFFFIIFFSVFDPKDIDLGKDKATKKDSIELKKAMDIALKYADNKEDSMRIMGRLEKDLAPAGSPPGNGFSKSSAGNTDTAKFAPVKVNMSWKYKTVAEYDSLQRALPRDERDGWFKRLIEKRQIVLKKKYGDEPSTIMKVWIVGFINQFPKMLFVSLPIFALILRLLYIRRKQFYYVDHGIFSIYLYIFSFILLLVAMGISALADATGWSVLNWLQLPLWLYYFFYNYKAMRNFYRQGRGKTILKFILLNLLAQIAILTLFVVFFVFTAFQI